MCVGRRIHDLFVYRIFPFRFISFHLLGIDFSCRIVPSCQLRVECCPFFCSFYLKQLQINDLTINESAESFFSPHFHLSSSTSVAFLCPSKSLLIKLNPFEQNENERNEYEGKKKTIRIPFVVSFVIYNTKEKNLCPSFRVFGCVPSLWLCIVRCVARKSVHSFPFVTKLVSTQWLITVLRPNVEIACTWYNAKIIVFLLYVYLRNFSPAAVIVNLFCRLFFFFLFLFSFSFFCFFHFATFSFLLTSVYQKN